MVKSNLKNIREKNLLTMRELAKKANVSHMTIFNIENGKYNKINFKTIKKISSALNVNPAQVFEVEPQNGK